jgi:hypothetical protein
MKMEFIKVLVESDDSKRYRTKMNEISYLFDEDNAYRSLKHIKKDDISLSIQASYGHYCTPRLTLSDLNDYSSMEFALIKEGEFIQVKDILPNFSALEEIEEYFDGSVYGYVPVNLIEELYKAYFA